MTCAGAQPLSQPGRVPASGTYAVHTRWGTWWLDTLMFGALLAMVLVAFVQGLASAEASWPLMVAGAAALAFGFLLLFHLIDGLLILELGCILRLNAQGLAASGLPLVPWRSVLGFDLQSFRFRRRPNWALLVAVDAPTAQRLARGWLRRGAVQARRQVVVVSLGHAREEAGEVLQMARAIAAWAGAPLTDWNHLVRVSTAMAERDASRGADDAVSDANADVVHLQNQLGAPGTPAREREAAMRNMASSAARVVASAEALLAAREQLERETRRSLRQWTWMGIALLAIGLAIVAARLWLGGD